MTASPCTPSPPTHAEPTAPCSNTFPPSSSPGQLSERTGTHVSKVRNVIIWGNHSSTQYPDVNHATVDGVPAREAVKDDAYLNGEFVTTVQQRGAAIIKASLTRCFFEEGREWGCMRGRG